PNGIRDIPIFSGVAQHLPRRGHHLPTPRSIAFSRTSHRPIFHSPFSIFHSLPHRPIRILDISCKPSAIHQRRAPHLLAHEHPHRLPPFPISRQRHGFAHIPIHRISDQFRASHVGQNAHSPARK